MLGRLTESFEQVPRTLRLVWRLAPGATLAIALLTLVGAALPLALAYGGKRTIDAVVDGHREGALYWVGFELVAVVLQALVGRLQSLVRTLLASRLSIEINMAILEKAVTLELRHFEDPEFYDRLTRARREASSRPLAVVSDTFGFIQSVLTLGGYIALLVQFSWLAVGGLVVAALPATIAEMRFSAEYFRMRNRRAPETRRLNYLEHVLANDGHVKEVKLFGLGPTILQRYRTLGEEVHAEDRALSIRRAVWGYLLSLVATGTFYGCYAFLAVAAALKQLSLGDLTLYVVAFRSGQQAFQSILYGISGMYEHNLYMTNLFTFLDGPAGRPAAPAPVAAAAQGTGIAFEGVGFRYPGQETWAVRGLDLVIPPGQSLALVGHNGSGKTTIVKLLTGLYEPTEGRVLLDGQDLRTLDKDALRRRIAVLFQDFNQYQLTLRENVAFGSVAHLGDDERTRRALAQGGATDVAAGLPAGLDTSLGRWFKETGVELSGGQWQRVALARAFMREEADILVLDEPTAALDADAEQAVFERLRALAKGRTTVLISHRFPTVRTADRILVLEGGEVVEQGSHAALLAKDGTYARLFRLQAAGYL